ncbi:MAG TPA: hypothetical protein PLT93_15045 [Phycisphaerae bacterium]|nr:hypothetical protein [Phycisphaerae bacterium]
MEYIKDSTGRTIGTIAMDGNKLVARSETGRGLGFYDPSSDETRDWDSHSFLAKGNILSALIWRAAGM